MKVTAVSKLGTLLFAALLTLPLLARADFPEKPITLVVPFSAGGSADATARQIAQAMSNELGQSVIVDNRAGAGGTIGSAYVARAAADGYTLMFATSSALVVSPALYKSAGYETLKSFAPVIEITRGPFILSVSNALPVHNAPELLAYAREHPGTLNYGSAGAGSAHHLAMESFKQATGMDALHVPYKGGAPAWTALMANDVQLLFDSMPGPLLFPGKVRPIAVTGPSRLSALPDVPTFAEQGIPNINTVFFFGVVGPAGMPPKVLAKLHDALFRGLKNQQVVAALETQGLTPSPGSAADFGALLAQEVPRYKELIQRIGLTLE